LLMGVWVWSGVASQFRRSLKVDEEIELHDEVIIKHFSNSKSVEPPAM